MAAQRAIDALPAAPGFCSCSSSTHVGPRPRVQVCDDIPIFREALGVELSAHGFDIVRCEPVKAVDAAAIDLTVCGVAADNDWALLQKVSSDNPVFVIVAEPFEDNEVRALAAGAVGVSRRGAPLAQIVTAICAVQRGYMVVEPALLKRLCTTLPPEAPFELAESEKEWLQKLSSGWTIARLAPGAGYSEREMHRVMRRLYQRMDVDNLYQALMAATRYHLLDPS